MPIVRFRQADLDDVLRIHDDTFRAAKLASFLWQPCQQIESLEKDCAKYVYKDDGLRGYGAAYPLDETHFRLNLLVDPAHTRRGMATHLLNEVEAETRRQGATYLQARTLERIHSGVPFLLSRGFEKVHVMRGMTLEAGDFAFRQWEPLGERLSALGFRVVTLRDESEDGNNPLLRLAELHRRAQSGWPSPDPTWGQGLTSEQLIALFTDIRFPERFSIMKRGDEYVGYTSAKNPPTGTAVDPVYRGLGVATYMKAWNIKMSIDDGETRFESASANPAMQKVNERLGYKFNGLDEVRFLKRL